MGKIDAMYLAFDHPDSLISHFKPNFASETHKDTDLVLGTRASIGRVRY